MAINPDHYNMGESRYLRYRADADVDGLRNFEEWLPYESMKSSESFSNYGSAASRQAANTGSPAPPTSSNCASECRPVFQITPVSSAYGTVTVNGLTTPQDFPAGERVTVSASPAPGYHFKSWITPNSSITNSGMPTDELRVVKHRQVLPSFQPETTMLVTWVFTNEVDIQPEEGARLGERTLNGPLVFVQEVIGWRGTPVALRAQPLDETTVVQGWSSSEAVSGLAEIIVPLQDNTYTVMGALGDAEPPFSVSISAASQGKGLATLGEGGETAIGAFLGTQKLKPNGSTKIKATPQQDWYFKGFQGDMSGTFETIPITNATQDVSVTAEFKRKVTIVTEVRTAADASAGNDPPECAGYIQLEPEAKSYAPGTRVDITAIPFQDCCWAFDHWDLKVGDTAYIPILSASTISHTIQEDKDVELVAIFKKKYDPWEIKLIAANQGLIDIAKQAIEEWNDEMQRDDDGADVQDSLVCSEYVVAEEIVCPELGTSLTDTDARLLYDTEQCGNSNWNVLVLDYLVLENGQTYVPWAGLARGSQCLITVANNLGTTQSVFDQSFMTHLLGHELGHVDLPNEADRYHPDLVASCPSCAEDLTCTTIRGQWNLNVMGKCSNLSENGRNYGGGGFFIHEDDNTEEQPW